MVQKRKGLNKMTGCIVNALAVLFPYCFGRKPSDSPGLDFELMWNISLFRRFVARETVAIIDYASRNIVYC